VRILVFRLSPFSIQVRILREAIVARAMLWLIELLKTSVELGVICDHPPTVVASNRKKSRQIIP